MSMFELEIDRTAPARLKVIGVGGAGSEVFIGSATGRIARYLTFSAAASGFTEMTIPAVGCIRRIASAGTTASLALASTTSNCFASRAILLYQGSTWTRLPDPPALTTVSDITASAPNNIVAVGNGGTGIQRWDGASWTSVSAPPTADAARTDLADAARALIEGDTVGADFVKGTVEVTPGGE